MSKNIKTLMTYDDVPFTVDKKIFRTVKGIGDKFGWHLDRDGYVVSNYKKKGRTITIKLHRLIMRLYGYKIFNLHVDHIDRDKTNNTKSNLRVAGKRLNNRNRSNVVNY